MTAPVVVLDPRVDLDEETIRELQPQCALHVVTKCPHGGFSESNLCQRPAAFIVRYACSCGERIVDLLCSPHFSMVTVVTRLAMCPTCLQTGGLRVLSSEAL